MGRRISFSKGLSGLVIAAGLGVSCGGGSPSGPSPVPTPTPGTPVGAFVFYDENGNGILDPLEAIRLPGVVVQIGGSTGQTASTGHAIVANVPPGAQTATVRPDSLPPYFVSGQTPVQVPASAEVAVPVTLAIGSNRANVYMAFGDSITFGDGSNDGTGYRSYLEADLRAYWGGSASVVNEGVDATRSNRGADRIGESLNRQRPAYTLILYGTNDWNDIECRDPSTFPCYTIDSLRSMIEQARAVQSNPILGTIIPVNPTFLDKDPTDRNAWVKQMNDQIRTLAKTEGVPVADSYATFMSQASLPPLYSDFLHPDEQGYSLLAQAFLRGITQPLSATSTARRGAARRSFFFSLGGR